MLELYALKLPDFVRDYNTLIDYISPTKKAKLSKFKNISDSYRTLLSEILIRKIAIDSFNIENSEIIIEFTAHGKPFIENNPFYFNISHSGKWIVAIIGNTEVGIDVEEIKPIDLSIADYCFSRKESAYLQEKKTSEKLISFYNTWTLKECFIKYVGQGLSIPLNSFSIMNQPEGIYIEQSVTSQTPFFKQYNIDPLHTIAACSNNNNFPKDLTVINYNDLLTILNKDK
ncbi:4'-phosphopantetheinyl transferase superfamily protein [Metabacillus idriensis]|nr:4'-phosphopantetheinyl transferase superfamily protein [Metabacillus idriensis]MCM3598069.1 4'-phosphopantetheinyl transferase superfamily protein [Metabacillus idriensis]